MTYEMIKPQILSDGRIQIGGVILNPNYGVINESAPEGLEKSRDFGRTGRGADCTHFVDFGVSRFDEVFGIENRKAARRYVNFCDKEQNFSPRTGLMGVPAKTEVEFVQNLAQGWTQLDKTYVRDESLLGLAELISLYLISPARRLDDAQFAEHLGMTAQEYNTSLFEKFVVRAKSLAPKTLQAKYMDDVDKFLDFVDNAENILTIAQADVRSFEGVIYKQIGVARESFEAVAEAIGVTQLGEIERKTRDKLAKAIEPLKAAINEMVGREPKPESMLGRRLAASQALLKSLTPQ